MNLLSEIPQDWREAIAPFYSQEQANALGAALQARYDAGEVIYPARENIFKEYLSDLEKVFMPTDSTLLDWAHNGVLLLNTCLTVRAHAAGSHRKLGWESLIQAILKATAQRSKTTAYILLGNDARAYRELVDDGKNVIFEAAHPSPLSAYHGFFGSRPFTTVNNALRARGEETIQW